MLQRMEEGGLVSRRRDADDNRLVRVYLTEAGREKQRFIMQQFLKLETAIFSGFDENERICLRRYLNRTLDNMGRIQSNFCRLKSCRL